MKSNSVHLPSQVRLKEALKTLASAQTGNKGDVWYRLPWYFQINVEGKITAYHEDHLPEDISKLSNIK